MTKDLESYRVETLVGGYVEDQDGLMVGCGVESGEAVKVFE